MADATTTGTPPESIDKERNTTVLKTSEVAAPNRFAGIDMSTGKVENADAADNILNVGYFTKEKTGDPDSKTGDGTIEWSIKGGVLFKDQTVTGASGLSDFGKLVYATDNQTLTLTRPSSGVPIGYVHRWKSGTTVDVVVWEPSLALLYGMLGTNRKIQHLGSVHSNALEGTSAITIQTHSMPFHGKVVSWYAVLSSKDSTESALDQDLNLDIGGTNLTGGVLPLDTSDAQGAKVDATAITDDGKNEFHTGDTLKVEMASGGTGASAGKATVYDLFAIVEMLPGA